MKLLPDIKGRPFLEALFRPEALAGYGKIDTQPVFLSVSRH
jgi:hypothetical protein